MSNRLEKMKEFYNTLSIDIDLAQYADESHNSYEDLRQAIEESNGFDQEIIYYASAIEFLQKNDPSLKESLELASEYGFEVGNLNSEILASLLATEYVKQDFTELESEITDFFNELNEEEEE